MKEFEDLHEVLLKVCKWTPDLFQSRKQKVLNLGYEAG
jgi:hypothetical protein